MAAKVARTIASAPNTDSSQVRVQREYTMDGVQN
jgi:hypothetical protein